MIRSAAVHIWYDHLNIWDSTDGSLDITNQSNYQTVSWTKFWYTSTSHPPRGTNDPTLNAGVEDAAPFTPPYTYTPDKAADVPALVQKCAGPQ